MMTPWRWLVVMVFAFATVAWTQQGTSPAVSTLSSPAAAGELTKPANELTPNQIASMQHQLADWPNLHRYREDNLKLGSATAGQPRVVFMGDSITDFWGRQHGELAPAPGTKQVWINRGISGQTTPQMLGRFQQDVIELHPETVVILAGINDIAGNTGPESLETIEANLRSMAMLAKAAHIRVVLCSVLPAARFPWRPEADPRDEVAALNTWLKTYAGEQRFTFLNYFPALVGPDQGMRPEFAQDGIHPTDAGYAVMEPMARAAVAKAMSSPRP